MIKERTIVACCGVVTMASSLWVSAALAMTGETDGVAAAPRFQMTAVTDRALGEVVLAGDYGTAIRELEGANYRRFESSTNLCVAYTLAGEYQKADEACAAAVELSERAAVRRDVAVALSNRGVLRAVSGDPSGARQDFSRALEIERGLYPANENLQLLEASDNSGA